MRKGTECKTRKRLLENRQGTTMAEVLVAFGFLMILMAALIHLAALSSDLLMAAGDMVSEQARFQEELCKREHDVQAVSVTPLEEAELVLWEVKMDDTGQSFDKTGMSLKLEGARLFQWTGRRLGMRVYQILYDGGEMEEGIVP